MVSPELLRKYPFFKDWEETELKAVAMLGEMESFSKGIVLYDAWQKSDTLYLLVEGEVEVYYVAADRDDPSVQSEHFLGTVTPGVMFGLSSMVKPAIHSTTTIAGEDGVLIRFPAAGLLILADLNPHLGFTLMAHVSNAAIEKLEAARVKLAAFQD
mgnify:CR=1 FL=1